MVVLSTLIRFVQEGRSHRPADGLKAVVSDTATVIRRDPGANRADTHPAPRRLEIPIRRLAPGDLVALSAGDMIPADCRVLTARDLFIAQAGLTGESLPLEKFADRRGDAQGPLEQSNLVFMGTNVVSGSAAAPAVFDAEPALRDFPDWHSVRQRRCGAGEQAAKVERRAASATS